MACHSRRVEQRRKEAIERHRKRNRRTPEQQLHHLDCLLGKGVGATKERTRLAEVIGRRKAKAG